MCAMKIILCTKLFKHSLFKTAKLDLDVFVHQSYNKTLRVDCHNDQLLWGRYLYDYYNITLKDKRDHQHQFGRLLCCFQILKVLR